MNERQPLRRATEPPCLRVSVARIAALLMVACVVEAHAQQLLDRVVARVGTTAITETDVRAAIGLGLVEVPEGRDPLADGTRQMIERRLIFQEVLRFQTAPPSDAAIADEVARMKARAGAGYDALARATGMDDERLRELARMTLGIQAHMTQRFGATAQAGLQDARDYYDKHPAEFTRNGTPLPFEQVETAARAAASAERRRASIAQWLADLRARAEVVEPTRP